MGLLTPKMEREARSQVREVASSSWERQGMDSPRKPQEEPALPLPDPQNYNNKCAVRSHCMFGYWLQEQ